MPDAAPSLGPTTEARFAVAFANGAVIPSTAAANLLGLDERTLGDLTDDQVIRAVRRGRRRGYVERDLRAFLAEGPGAETEQWASGSRRKAGSGITSSKRKVAAFTARPALKVVAQPKR